jgi:VanZ family protein
LKSPLIKHALWIIWLIILIVLCLTPGDQLPRIEWELISIGTLAHFGFYLGLICLQLFAFEKKSNLFNWRLYFILIASGILIGYSIELIQGNFIYQRYYDQEDIAVNSIGTIIGAIFYSLIGRKLV